MTDFTDKHQSSWKKLDDVVVIHGRLLKQLQTYLLQTKEVQSLIYQDFLEYNSNAEHVLREIVKSDVNRDTIREHDSEIDEMVRKEEEDFYSDNNNHRK